MSNLSRSKLSEIAKRNAKHGAGQPMTEDRKKARRTGFVAFCLGFSLGKIAEMLDLKESTLCWWANKYRWRQKRQHGIDDGVAKLDEEHYTAHAMSQINEVLTKQGEQFQEAFAKAFLGVSDEVEKMKPTEILNRSQDVERVWKTGERIYGINKDEDNGGKVNINVLSTGVKMEELPAEPFEHRLRFTKRQGTEPAVEPRPTP